jgi:adenine phosphoribosyltransferase
MSPLKQYIRDVPDFPKPGILFRDIAPLLQDHFEATTRALSELLTAGEWDTIDAVAGIESRGFILGAALAHRHRKGFVPVRKQGKLPPPVVNTPYDLEYGTGVLEMHRGSGRLLLVDDVLATGGTLRAAATLSREAGFEVSHLAVLIDLKLVADFRWEQLPARTVMTY